MANAKTAITFIRHLCSQIIKSSDHEVATIVREIWTGFAIILGVGVMIGVIIGVMI